MQIDHVGSSLAYDVPRSSVPDRPGCLTVWPLKPDGTEMIWGLTPASMKRRLAEGYVKVVAARGSNRPTIYYLTSGQIADIERGELLVTGRDEHGVAVVEFRRGKSTYPSTQWDRDGHQSKIGGTALLGALGPGRRFPFPKSLYAVEDALRFFVADKPNAVVLDFFAGSGTTAHAVMRLNKQDGGRRQCISVTNNEVSAEEQRALREQGLRPGDAEWEKHGICDYITKPRIEAAITGKTPEGQPIKGDYKFTDEFPMSDGFEENAEFFTLTYEDRLEIAHRRGFQRIAPLLWLKAGARGRRIDEPAVDFAVADTYAILFDLDSSHEFLEAVAKAEGLNVVFVVTDDERAYQDIVAEVPSHLTTERLYGSYLTGMDRGPQVD